MCGICGAVNLHGRPIPDLEQRLEVMNELIAHRGPDDAGLWTHELQHEQEQPDGAGDRDDLEADLHQIPCSAATAAA